MKKYSKIGLGLLLFSVLVLAGCGCQKTIPGPNEPTAEDNSGVMDTVKESLYSLMTKGAGVKCTIDDPQSGQFTMYTKGDKAKVEGFSYMGGFQDPNSGPPKEEKGTMINDGTWTYMWSGKEGMKFNIQEMKNLAPEDQGQNKENSQSEAMDWKDWVKQMDEKGTKYDCGPTVLSDSDFVPPSDVQFQDWGEMMKGFMKMGEELKSKMPGETPPAMPPVSPSPSN